MLTLQSACDLGQSAYLSCSSCCAGNGASAIISYLNPKYPFLMLLRFSTKWCCWALNAACLALIQCLIPQVILFNANQKMLFANWSRWRGKMRNQAKEKKCYMVNESHRRWYFEVWAEEGHMRRRERKFYPGSRSYQHKESGLIEWSEKE